MNRLRLSRDGFALLAVLWVIVAVASLAVASSLTTRNAIASSHNRSDITRATWLANDCAERVRAAIAIVLQSTPRRDGRGLSGWSGLDSAALLETIVTEAHCSLRFTAAGSRIDINHADAEMLGSLLGRIGISQPTRDSMVDALLDWRDRDDVPRPLGAERAWYAARGRLMPRNGAFADVREIARVRGFEKLQGLDSLLGVEPGRLTFAQASLTALATLPGLGEEAVARVAEQRGRGMRAEDMNTLGAELSPGARQRMLARYSDLVADVAVEPDAWIVEARSDAGSPAITIVVELRLVRAGDRAALVRRRRWIE